jgi:hypothetical protein
MKYFKISFIWDFFEIHEVFYITAKNLNDAEQWAYDRMSDIYDIEFFRTTKEDMDIDEDDLESYPDECYCDIEEIAEKEYQKMSIGKML